MSETAIDGPADAPAARRSRRLALGGLVAAALLTVAGCSGAVAPKSKAAYVKAVDAVCKTQGLEVEKTARKLGTKPTRKEAEQYVVDELVPALRTELAAMRKVKVPSSEKSASGKLWDAVDRRISDAEKSPDQVVSDPDFFADINDQLVKYGFTQCGTK